MIVVVICSSRLTIISPGTLPAPDTPNAPDTARRPDRRLRRRCGLVKPVRERGPDAAARGRRGLGQRARGDGGLGVGRELRQWQRHQRRRRRRRLRDRRLPSVRWRSRRRRLIYRVRCCRCLARLRVSSPRPHCGITLELSQSLDRLLDEFRRQHHDFPATMIQWLPQPSLTGLQF